jgi:hypothetical protein
MYAKMRALAFSKMVRLNVYAKIFILVNSVNPLFINNVVMESAIVSRIDVI